MTTLTPKEIWQPKFLKALAERPIVARACRLAQVSRETAYRYREEDPEFAQAWQHARDTAIDLLEEKAWKRAETESDTLAIFLLKSHRPDVYQERSRLDVLFGRMPDDQLEGYLAERLAQLGPGGEDRPGPPALPAPEGGEDRGE